MKIVAVILFLVSSTTIASNTWVVEAKDIKTNKITTFEYGSPGVHPFKPDGFKKVTCDIVVDDVKETNIEKLKTQNVSVVCRRDDMSFGTTHGCAVPPLKIEKGISKASSMARDGDIAKVIEIYCK